MFQFISSKLAGFISVLWVFVSTLSAQILNSSENQRMELIAHKQMGSEKEKAFAKKMITDNRQHSTNQARLGYMNMFFNTDFSKSVKGLQTPIFSLIWWINLQESKKYGLIKLPEAYKHE